MISELACSEVVHAHTFWATHDAGREAAQDISAALRSGGADLLNDGFVFVSLPDNLELPLRVWLLRIAAPTNKVMPFFDEEQVKDLAAKLEQEKQQGSVAVLGPYNYED